MEDEIKEKLEDADMNITNILSKDRHKVNVKKVIGELNDSWK